MEYKKSKIQISEYILLFICFYYAIMYIHPYIYSIIGGYSLIIISIMIILIFILNINKLSDRAIAGIAIIFINLIVGSLINNTGFGSLLTMIDLYILIIFYNKIYVRKEILNIIISTFFVVQFIYLLMPKEYYNPNTLGYRYFIMSVFTVIFFNNIKSNKKSLKLFYLLILIMNFILMYQTESRGSLLGFFVFILFLFILKFVKYKSVINIIVYAIVIGSIIFPLIYVYMWNNNIKVQIDYSDKNFYSGRQVIWSKILREFKEKPMYGVGSNFKFEDQDKLNVHNSLFAILTIYGGINFLFFIFMFLHFLKSINAKRTTQNSDIAFAGIIGMIVVGYFETNLIWLNVFGYFVCLAVIAEFKNDNEENINEIKKSF